MSLVSHSTAARRALDAVLAERTRQVVEEGWLPSHDDQHDLGQLGLAAALYAIPYEAKIAGVPLCDQDTFIGLHMTLEIGCGWHLKPEPDRRKRLVKAAALLLAEIERLDRDAVSEGRS